MSQYGTASAPQDNTQRPKRPQKVSIQLLMENLSDIEEKLSYHLEFDLSTLSENPHELQSFAKKFKVDLGIFNGCSRQVSTRLLEMGSTFASQEVRQKRLECQKDAQEVKATIDQMLKNQGFDNISSLESCSIASRKSGFSLSSQISEQKGINDQESYLSIKSKLSDELLVRKNLM